MSRAAEFLLTQYNLRKDKNKRYSQRAFARLIDLNPGRVNHYFSGERQITKKMAQKISQNLGLDAKQEAYFIHLCETDIETKRNPTTRRLQDDELALIVEWHHFAILSLMSTKDFQSSPEWIAERLGIPLDLVSPSLERLERIGLIKNLNGKYVKQPGSLTTTEDIPSQFLMMSHQDSLRHIIHHLPNVAVEKRDVSSITLAIDDRKVQEAKTLIRQFRRRLAAMLTKGKNNQVYTLNIQLFPLSKEPAK